ncbi:MAG TPA: 2-oxoglutarate and iron-dependent oxygenase domain-containing protein [Xanthobacteraceae bacterium]|nr:2-oxoglutarate and iron-dependent oxygenase domain-containing protein [Xanthobacteraceae bacterium]
MNVTLEARHVSGAQLPIVDVAGLSSARPQTRRKVAEQLCAACLDKGFLYIVGHGIPAGLVSDVLAEARRFFNLPLELKMSVDKALSFCNRGYEPLRGQTLEAGAPPDLKEGFYIGPELARDDPRVIAREFNQGPNQWPDDLPTFKPAMLAYFAAMLDLGERLMRGLALSLDLKEDYFAEFCKGPIATLRLLHYPPQPADASAGEKGAGAHTDFGALTFLLQDQVGGLQVWDDTAGSWIHADPITGSYIVNLGDMIARWTNDRYRSTLHRVVNASGRERYSVPFFFTGRPNQVVSCVPTCLQPGASAKYPPITIAEHMRAMYRKTYGTG